MFFPQCLAIPFDFCGWKKKCGCVFFVVVVVEVKRLAGGSREETRLIRGVVFRHNVAHRKMRTHIEKPTVLLLSCPIDVHKSKNKLANFDLLLKQVIGKKLGAEKKKLTKKCVFTFRVFFCKFDNQKFHT